MCMTHPPPLPPSLLWVSRSFCYAIAGDGITSELTESLVCLTEVLWGVLSVGNRSQGPLTRLPYSDTLGMTTGRLSLHNMCNYVITFHVIKTWQVIRGPFKTRHNYLTKLLFIKMIKLLFCLRMIRLHTQGWLRSLLMHLHRYDLRQ